MVSDEQLKKNKYRRKKVMLKRVHTKGMVALVMVVVILMALGGQVFRINYTHGETYAKAVLDHQTYTSTELPYKRGQILTGDGTVLAYSERVYNLILDVKLMLSDGEYKEPTLSALCKYFNLKVADDSSLYLYNYSKNKDFKEIDNSLNTITNISMKIIKKINEKTKSLENSKDIVLANNTIEI